MPRYLNTLSTILFYTLGSSFFLAYILMRNEIADPWPLWWLEIADMPLLLIALLYGGLSLYLSLQPEIGGSKAFGTIVALPLSLLFLLFLFLNFWTPNM